MSNPSLLLRPLITYALFVFVAVTLGYWLSTPGDTFSFYCMMLALGLAVLPLLLRFHHFWLIALWNTTAMLFFLPGRPSMLLILIFVSLLISVVTHALNRQVPFIKVKSITMPLIFLGIVILLTAKFRGGLGLAIAGSANIGGKRYIYLFSAIVGYLALTAHRIPPRKAVLYTSAFFASGLTQVISDLPHFVPPSALYYVLLIFPASNWWSGGSGQEEFIAGRPEIGRLGGIGAGCVAILLTLMAIYGIRGVFNVRKFWRLPVFLLAFAGCLASGFRSMLVLFILVFGVLFVLEKLLSSRSTPILLCAMLLAVTAVIPFADKLPLPMQRAMAVVPYIHLDPFARDDARDSTEWRLRMWQIVLPQVPQYLILGKGLSINAEELAAISAGGVTSSEAEGSILAGDYHNGPLSLIIPFGLAGTIGFLWLLIASLRLLYSNYRYGDDPLRRINRFLLAIYIAKAIFFFAVFGSFFGDLAQFLGIVGLSVALNGGMRRPVPAPAAEEEQSRELAPFRLAPMNARLYRN